MNWRYPLSAVSHQPPAAKGAMLPQVASHLHKGLQLAAVALRRRGR